MMESFDDLSPNERLGNSLPDIAKEFRKLWGCWANTTIAFAGGGNLRGDPQPDEMGMDWGNKVGKLIEGCTIPITDRQNWGELVTLLNDLSEQLILHFSGFRTDMPRLDRQMHDIRMERNALALLEIFKDRGYLKEDRPFEFSE